MYFSEGSNRSGGFQSCLSLQSCALPPVCPDGNRGDPQAPLTQHVQGQGMTASGLPVHPKGERSFSIVRCAVPLGSTMIRVHFPAFTSHCVYRFDYNAACRKGQPPTEILRIFSKRQNNAGAGRMADPRRGTLSFVTQKFFCFGAINNRRNMVLFLFAATSDGCFTRARRWSLAPARPLYHLPVWCPGGVISNVSSV